MRQCLTALLVLCFFTVTGQPFPVQVSATFEEPKEIGTKVFQCSNGNTLLFRFLDGGIRVVVYNVDRKSIAQTILPPSSWGAKLMKEISVKGIFNIGGEVTLFLSTFTKIGAFSNGDEVFTRLTISPLDGRMVSFTKIAESRSADFLVQKNKLSDTCTIAIVESTGTGKKIEIRQFDGIHQEIRRDSFATPEDDFKQVRYLGMATKTPGEGIICTYEYNTRRHGNMGSRLVMISFRDGHFQQHTLDKAEELRETKAIVLYNPQADLYQIVTATAEGSTGGFFQNNKEIFSSLVIGIRAKDFQRAFTSILDEEALNATSKERYGKRATYAGLPINALVSDDGTLSIITQAMSVSTSQRNTVTTSLGDIGILQYASSGKQISSSLIPNSQTIWRATFDPLYQKGEDISTVWFNHTKGGIYLSNATNTGYYYTRFITTQSGNFFFLNEHENSYKQGIKKIPYDVTAISLSQAIGLKVTSDQLDKFHLLGASGNFFDTRFALFSSGDYSAETGVFAVMIVEKKGRTDKKARLAWVTCK
jgi:hypothetical protein